MDAKKENEKEEEERALEERRPLLENKERKRRTQGKRVVQKREAKAFGADTMKATAETWERKKRGLEIQKEEKEEAHVEPGTQEVPREPIVRGILKKRVPQIAKRNGLESTA